MATGAEASTGKGGGPPSHLPLQLIPRFQRDKRRRVCQKTSVSQGDVAGRAPATLVEGAAFQKVSRISPEKLKSPDGVTILAEQLGGSWGRLQVEDKFHYFEQAIFQTQQKQDETNDSYIARYDAQFKELLSRKVGLEEIRAYVLLRHSQLTAEDKKRVIVESKGDLQYSETIKAIRLLGSRFFGDLQTKGGASSGTSLGPERTKVYDVNMTEADAGEDIHMASHEEEVDEEEIFAYFFEQYAEDALYIAEFEDGIIEAVQRIQPGASFLCIPRSQSTASRQSEGGQWEKALDEDAVRDTARKVDGQAAALEKGSGQKDWRKGSRHRPAGCVGQLDIGRENVQGTLTTSKAATTRWRCRIWPPTIATTRTTTTAASHPSFSTIFSRTP